MMEYTIYEKPLEGQREEDSPEVEITEPLHVTEQEVPLCQNGQTEENRALSPLCQKRQTGKRQTENGGLLNTNILNTKELSVYPSLSLSNPLDQTGTDEDGMRHRQLKERLLIEHLYNICRTEIIETVFDELCKREESILEIISADAVEKICLAAEEQQRREPDRRLPDLINSYIDNIIVGIRAAPKAEVSGTRNMWQTEARQRD